MTSEIPHVNIIICTPGQFLFNAYVQSLLRLSSYFSEKGITFAFANGASSHVADAREVTLSGTRNNSLSDQRPLQGNCTYDKLMWIDSDISFKPEDVMKLYESDKDIISGAYLLASGEVTAYDQLLGKAYMYDDVKKMTEPIIVAGTGFGFICIKSGVFESLSRPWFQSDTITTEIDEKDFTFNMIGEDLSLLSRAKKAGFDCWFDPTVRVNHHKLMQLTWEGILP